MSELRTRRRSGDSDDLTRCKSTTKHTPNKETRWFSCRTVFHLVLINLCLIQAVCLYYLFPGNPTPDEVYGDMTEAEIVRKFPGFFRKVTSDREIEAQHQLHGCCNTTGWIRTLDVAYTLHRKKKYIVQLENYKQYFYYEKTRKIKDCIMCNCKCHAHDIFVPALYRSTTDPNDVLASGLVNASFVYKCFN